MIIPAAEASVNLKSKIYVRFIINFMSSAFKES
jgi:hypothetical protein